MGHAVAPPPVHAEPHHLKPPEHVKAVEDPGHQKRLTTLADGFHTSAKTALDRVLFGAVKGRGAEAMLENVRQLREKAGEYSLGLYGYWSYAKERFSDSYVYRGEGNLAELGELLKPLKDTDARLEKQLKDWAKVTSPYGDSYDVARIEDVGRELSDTLKIASVYLTNALKKLPEGEKGKRDLAFNSAMFLTISGLAEQIGNRMKDLGSGKKVPNVTLSNETVELMNRAGQDDTRFSLGTKFDEMSSIRDALKGLEPGDVNKRLTEHLRIEREIDTLRKENKDDPDFAERLKKLETQLEGVGLGSFFEALDQHTGKSGDAQLKDDGNEFKNLNRKLRNPKAFNVKPEDIGALVEKRKALLDSMLPKLRSLMDRTVQQQSQELTNYEARLQGNTDKFNKEKKTFWSDSKKKILGNIEKLAGKEKRKQLDEAFKTGGFSDKIEAWLDAVTDETKVKPEKMQSLATDVVKTADSYIERVQGALKDADANPSLLQLKNELVSALTAIKLSTAEKLRLQFDNHRFD